jgi:hypothetical protein
VSSYATTVAAYAGVLMLGVVAELAAMTRPRLWAGFGQVVTWALRRRCTQLGLLLAWWWLGWHWVTAR